MILIGEQSGGKLSTFMFKRIGLPLSSDARYIGAISKEDLQPMAVVAYNGWQEKSVFMHVVVDVVRNYRHFLREAFTYPFVTCNKERVYGLTPITAEKALLLAKRLGFKPISWTPDFVLQVMEKADCRWIRDDQRPARTDAAAGTAVHPD